MKKFDIENSPAIKLIKEFNKLIGFGTESKEKVLATIGMIEIAIKMIKAEYGAEISK